MKPFKLFALAAVVALAGCHKPQEMQSRPLTTGVQSSAWETPFGQGTIYTTRHYRICSTVTRPSLMAAAPGFMEAAHDYYSQLTGLKDSPQDPLLPIYLVATRRQWADLTSQMVKDNLNIYLSIDAGGYCYQGKCVFWDVGGEETLRLAAHEGLHQFLGSRVKHLPIWLEEGLCVCAEGMDLRGDAVVFDPRRNLARLSVLRSALVAHHWIPLEQLIAMDGGDAVQNPRPGAGVEYYAQLWALAIYLQSRPDTRADVQRIIADAAEGKLSVEMTPDLARRLGAHQDGRDAGKLFAAAIFLKYVARDLPAFEAGYRQFARKLADL